MRRKISIIGFMCFFFALSLTAQTDSVSVETPLSNPIRIGYVSRDSVLARMPESERIGREYEALEKEYTAEYDNMVKGYNQKVKSYIENSRTLNETIRLARQAEITEIEKRIQAYKESYLKALDSYKKQAYTPLYERLDSAVRQAAQEARLTILFDRDTPVYMSPDCVDITPAVILILGI
jgi:Skp family chaperone for outer membrane proteins